MNRKQLEHVIRASADIADDDEIIVVGSQAILGGFPDAPPEQSPRSKGQIPVALAPGLGVS